MKNNDRKQAVDILKQVIENKTPLSRVLKKNTTVTPFTQEICFGVLRYYFRLNRIAQTMVKKPPKEFDVWLVILIGLYQLAYLNTSHYAAVNETVNLLEPLKKSWAKGLVNAVLRRFVRDNLSQKLFDSEFDDNHPQWLLKELKKYWPQHTATILKANDSHPPMSLRVNQRHLSTQAYLQKLKEKNIEAHQNSFLPHSIILKKPMAVNQLPGFHEGDVSVQDCAAQLAIGLLDLSPNHRILDACAAPGGKTAYILESVANLSFCLALDVDAHRLEKIQDNLIRLKLSATLKVGDALKPETWWDGILFDRILLDAPCSATGVIRRHPDIKILRTEEEIEHIATVQHDMLRALWPLLAPGGRLIYATCSIMHKENEQQIARFKQQHPNCNILNTTQPWGHCTGHGWQILPGEHEMDGFFYSILIKKPCH